MSHIRKNIQKAKQYEDDIGFETEYQKREIIVKERIRQAHIRAKVLEFANCPKWINAETDIVKYSGERNSREFSRIHAIQPNITKNEQN
jgi:hypothetical protein